MLTQESDNFHKELSKELQYQVRKNAKSMKIRQKVLAEKVGIEATHLSSILNLRQKSGDKTLIKLANLVNVDLRMTFKDRDGILRDLVSYDLKTMSKHFQLAMILKHNSRLWPKSESSKRVGMSKTNFNQLISGFLNTPRFEKVFVICDAMGLDFSVEVVNGGIK